MILPCTDSIELVDLRTLTFDVPPQEILTKDSVTVAVDAVCYFKTFDPVAALTKTQNSIYSTRQLAATTVRNFMGLKTLQDILQDKEVLSDEMRSHLNHTTYKW